MKKLVGGIVVAAALAAAAYRYGPAWARKSEKTSPAAQDPPAKVEKADIVAKVEEVGSLEPLTQVKVKANATGSVRHLEVELGSRVRAGQLLAVIQPGRPGESYRPSTVSAPMDGVVIEKLVEEGDTVTSGLSEFSGGSVLLTIADLSVMLVKLSINEVDVPRLKPGQDATVFLDALPGKSYPARLLRLSPMARVEQGSSIRVFDAVVKVGETHEELKPGMTARVQITTESRLGAASLPVETVFDEGGKHVVYRQKTAGAPPERQEVELGASDERRVEILKGLALGDSVSRIRPPGAAPKEKNGNTWEDDW